MSSSHRTLPEYTSGAYMLDPSRHSEDSVFKARCFLRALEAVHRSRNWRIRSIADVGCGSGAAIGHIVDGLDQIGLTIEKSLAYDVYPEVAQKTNPRTRFIHGDFAADGEDVDLVTLFDVFEHVPDPLNFLHQVASRCNYLGLHVPLESNWTCGLRNKYNSRLHQPGHLIYLDVENALTILSLAGLRTVHFEYTPAFMAPSGGQSVVARLFRLPRRVAFSVSPWALSKTLGGCSLMVLAETPRAWTSEPGAA